MKIQERIDAAEEELTSYRDQMTELQKSLDSEEADTDAIMLAIEETSEAINKAVSNREVLLKARDSMAVKAVEASPVSPAVVKSNHLGTSKNKPEDLLVKTAVATMEAHLRRLPVEHVLENRFDDEVKAVHGLTQKAAQNPAMSNVATWAQELTRESYGAFMDLLVGKAVLPSLGLTRHEFNGYSKINIPVRTGTQASNPNLAGAFRAEGAPIRVGAESLGTISLTPKLVGIIGTFTLEMLERSVVNFEQAVRDWMIGDTAYAMDALFLSATAATADAPAGIQAGLKAADTAASAGASAANITADIRARLQQLTSYNMGQRPVWVMNPARAWGIQLSLTAAGTPAFPSMANGVLMGVPVVTSTNVPDDTVYLIDAAQVTYAGSAPRFMGTEVATIHEEYNQADVKPIVDGTPTTANPVRSLFQTNSAALRCTWEMDWAKLRDGGVQVITGAAW